MRSTVSPFPLCVVKSDHMVPPFSGEKKHTPLYSESKAGFIGIQFPGGATMATRLSLSQVCESMIYYKNAMGRSPHTIASYKNSFKKLRLFLEDDDPLFASIKRETLIRFFSWLREEHESEPDGVASRGAIQLSAKSIFNIHTDLSTLWAYALNEGYAQENVLRTIERPTVLAPVIETFTREEMVALIEASNRSKSWKNRPQTTNTLLSKDRDHAVVLTLLDTGCRVSEVCGMKYHDLNMKTSSIKVYGKGRGGQKKERLVYFSARTGQAIFRYLAPRIEQMRDDTPIFLNMKDEREPLTRNGLGELLDRLAERANVSNVFPHRFRHTFAINYLRNGGDLFTLRDLLGHTTLDMVQRYARIAEVDCAQTHLKASPVEKWKLK